jgi:hypothetical protein
VLNIVLNKREKIPPKNIFKKKKKLISPCPSPPEAPTTYSGCVLCTGAAHFCNHGEKPKPKLTSSTRVPEKNNPSPSTDPFSRTKSGGGEGSELLAFWVRNGKAGGGGGRGIV